MIRPLIVLALVVAAGVVWMRLEKKPPAPEPREKVLLQIDSLAGQAEAWRAFVGEGLARLEAAREALATARTRARVRAEMKTHEISRLRKLLDETEGSLRGLRERGAPDADEVVLAGRTYSRDEVERLARRLTADRDRLGRELKAQAEAQAALEGMARDLARREEELTSRLAPLREQLRLLDARLAEVRALREAAQSPVPGAQALGESLRQAERQMRELHVAVETERRLRQAEWRELVRPDEIAPRDTPAEIDAALNVKP